MDMLTNGRRVDDESFTYLNWSSIITNYFMDRFWICGRHCASMDETF